MGQQKSARFRNLWFPAGHEAKAKAGENTLSIPSSQGKSDCAIIRWPDDGKTGCLTGRHPEPDLASGRKDKTQMKPLSIIIILIGSMLLVPAAIGQMNTTPPPVAPRFNLSGTWKASGLQGPVIVRFEQEGDRLRGYFGGDKPAPTDVMGFVGYYAGPTTIGGQSLVRAAANGQPAVWKDQVLTVDDTNHVHFKDHPEIVRLSSPQTEEAQNEVTQGMDRTLATILVMMLAGSNGEDESASVSDQSDREEEARRQLQNREEERERQQRDQCEMNGGTVSSGIFSGFSCQ